jgi:DNA-binding IclR family transcriptional regulator
MKKIKRSAAVSVKRARAFNNSLARGLEVLRAFPPDDRGLSNAEIARKTGIPKPTVSRLTFTLVTLGYLNVSEETGRYQIHPHVLTLGYSVLSRLDIRQVARPLMQDLADFCHGAVALGMRDGLRMVLLERTRAREGQSLMLDIGSDLDMTTSAMGRAYIAALPGDQRTRLLRELRQANPKRWPGIASAIKRAIEEFQAVGYCTSAGEWRKEVNGVGVPVVIENRSLFCLNCNGLVSTVTVEMLPELGKRLVELAGIIEISQGEGRIDRRSAQQT